MRLVCMQGSCLLPPIVQLQPAVLPPVMAVEGAPLLSINMSISNAGNASLAVALEVIHPSLILSEYMHVLP